MMWLCPIPEDNHYPCPTVARFAERAAQVVALYETNAAEADEAAVTLFGQAFYAIANDRGLDEHRHNEIGRAMVDVHHARLLSRKGS